MKRVIQTSADLETNTSVISRMWLLLKAGFWIAEVRESRSEIWYEESG